jgi:hypothetical protein
MNMTYILSHLRTGSQTFSYLLALLVLALLLVVMMFGAEPDDFIKLLLATFGPVFMTLSAALIFAVLYCWQRQLDYQVEPSQRLPWTQAGMHLADGLSTLALTFTLLGISLGIGTLTEKSLTPETIQLVIKDLTKHFSLAFMTTVFGLPMAAVLRALIQITETKCASQTALIRQ